MTATATPDHEPVDVDELVELVRHIGGGVRVEEIAYQLGRRGHPATLVAITDALCEAEARGLLTPWAWTTGPEASA